MAPSLPDIFLEIVRTPNGPNIIRVRRISENLNEGNLETFRLNNSRFDVLIAPRLGNIDRIIKFATRYMVPVTRLTTFSRILYSQISDLTVMKLEFSCFNRSNVYNNFNIDTLINLRCLVLKYSDGSTMPMEVTFPALLKHFNLVIFNSDGDNIPANLLLEAARKGCCQLEHISVNTNRDMALKPPFGGMDLLVRKNKKTIRSVLFMTALVDPFRNSLDFTGDYDNLETMIIAFNEGLISPSEEIVKAYLLSLAKSTRGLQTLGLISIPFLIQFGTFFEGDLHIFSNIKVLCLKGFSLTGSDFEVMLNRFPNLQMLYIANCDVQYTVLLTYVSVNRKLRLLCLDDAHCKECKLRRLVAVKHQTLDLVVSRIQINNVELRDGGEFQELENFILRNFFSWHRDSLCLSDECDEISVLTAGWQND